MLSPFQFVGICMLRDSFRTKLAAKTISPFEQDALDECVFMLQLHEDCIMAKRRFNAGVCHMLSVFENSPLEDTFADLRVDEIVIH